MPLCCDNDEALALLGGVADLFLLHDRPILNRIDDPVVRRDDGRTTTLRRARGLAPGALELPPGFASVPPMLAMGAELKNSFALCQPGRVVVSHHMGDLRSAPLLRHYRARIEHEQRLFGFTPERIVVDRHPDYLSSQLERELAARHGCPVVEVQHHHAHLAAVMFEHGLPLDGEAVVGVVLDGLGLGEAGQLWGGEFLLADYRRYHRRGTFEPVVLLGGGRAMTEPWRNILAHLLHGFDWPALVAELGDLPLLADLQTRPVELLAQMARDNLNSPLCSSAGRLFDAVAAALGICRDRISYEGQAALELEALAGRAVEAGGYPVEVLRRDGLWRLGFRPLWQALLADLAQGAAPPAIAARFHNALGRGVADLAGRICEEEGVGRVVLAGGVFQNALLKSAVSRHLHQRGIQVLTPEAFPAGDGAISLGQVAVAAAREGD